MDNRTKKSLDKRLFQIEQDITNLGYTTSKIIDRIEKKQDEEFSDLRQRLDHASNRIDYLENKFLK